MIGISNIDEKVKELIIKRNIYNETLQKLEAESVRIERHMNIIEEAKIHLQNVAKKTQESFKLRIENIVTVALQSVFDDPYNFVVDFNIKGNKTGCDFYFEKNGIEIDPLTASGGGAVDVAAFALRISLWTLEVHRKRPVMILDEPFKCVSKDLKDKVGMMVKRLSDELGIQLIMVTHEDTLIDASDKVFRVSMDTEGRSQIVIEKE